MKIQTIVIFTLACFALLPATEIHAAKRSEHLLGPTGLSGSISKNSIKVSHIAEGSPADGKVEKGDVIVGIGGEKFNGDVRRMFAAAIDAAETEEAGGKLPLLFSGNKTVELQLQVLGSYSAIAPYKCPKTELIIERAAEYLANEIKESLRNKRRFNSAATHSALLGLMATGERKYINLVADAIKHSDILDPDADLIEEQLAGERAMGYVGWYWGYHCILLGEYYMLTGDRSALSALKIYAVALAKGQDAGGLWGHRMAVNGRLPGYAQMNQSSLSCFMGMLMARKCGIDDPDLNKGIAKTYAYYATHIGRGGFNYGVHGPDRKRFNNNGMSGLAAMCMALLNNKEGVRFFSGLSATSYDNLEQGHASNFFNPLWTPLAASLSGPEVTHGFFMNSLWFNTTYRAWDGSFLRSPGKERGRAGSQTGAALLTYCLPRKALFITGRDQDPSLWLKGDAATEVLQMSQIDYRSKSVDELLSMFDFPFPQVRIPTVWSLRGRDPEFIPKVVSMLESGNKLQKFSALEYFGYQCPSEQAHPQIEKVGAILRNKNEDAELRAKAAAMLASHGEAAYAYYQDMLQLVVDPEPDDPFQDVDQSVGKSLNMLCSRPYAAGLVKDKRLFYTAARKLIDHKRQHARSAGIKMLAEIPMEDFPIMAEPIIAMIEDKDRTFHSYHSWHSTIGPAIEILSHLNIEEGINYAAGVLDREGGKWGFKVRMVCASLPNYGANAKDVLAVIKADKRFENIEKGRFRGMWQRMVKAIEEDPSPNKLITLEEALR